MVDAVVSFVVGRLGDFLVEKAAFLQGVRDQVKWLKDELRYMHRFLQDAEEKQYGNATLREWVSDIRELAYDIEDLLDTFHLKIQGVTDDDEGTMEETSKSGCLPSMCSCIVEKGKKKVNLYNIGKEIEEFKDRINDLSRRRQLYGLQDSGNYGQRSNEALGKLKGIRRVTSFAVEKNVVGFEDDADELLTKLLDDEPRRFIISIYGMGGLGKTTLAGKLYHNNDVRKRFNCHAWVSVSQDYTTRDLLQRITNSFEFGTINMEELEKMNEEALERYLYRSLQELSYVVVIDDVWDKEAWVSLKRAFPDNKNGSRVIVTTRNKEVAEHLDERTYAHKLRYLRSDESWQLFWERTSHSINMYEGLEKLGREMVQKCNGLPLAIIVLGGLLSTRKPQEWQMVHDQIWRHLKNDSIEISHLLALSFDYLPYQLKQCFLYLGIFPEDFEINMNQLIRLLVAEGFILQDENRVMEEVAKDYLDELVNRSLLQVKISHQSISTTYQVHDILRDLAIEKRLQTLEVVGVGAIRLPAEIGKLQELRHLIGNFFEGPLSIDSLQKLQTLSVVNIETWVKIKPEKLVGLRSLGLREDDHVSIRMESCFDSLVKLKSLQTLFVCLFGEPLRSFQPLSHCQHLVDLRIRGRIEKVPEDIHQLLPNLECLTLWESDLEDDPIHPFHKLPNLMFFNLCSNFYRGDKMICRANGFFRLEILQIFQQIEELQVEEGALPSLRGLRIPNDCELITPETMRLRIQKTLL